MEFFINDLRLLKPYMMDLKERDPARYESIVSKYNEVFKDLVPNSRNGPSILPFLKEIFCDTQEET